MKLILIAFILFVVVHDTTAEKRRKKSRDPISVTVGDVCYNVHCEGDLICRVMTKCGRKRRDEITCLRCVPDSVDKICNNNGYRRAILAGTPRIPTPLSCHVNNVPGSFQCPNGADCIPNPDHPGFGICCYEEVPAAHGGHVTNSDTKCSGCIPDCRPGYECQKDVVGGVITSVCRRLTLLPMDG